MADYYSQGVIDGDFLLSTALVTVLSAQNAKLYSEEDGETVLDGIVNERTPLKSYSIVFGEGWDCWDGRYENLEEATDFEDTNLDKWSDETKRLAMLSMEDLLHEILKVNPEAHSIDYKEAHTCSKMRFDGFGGMGVFVTRKGYLYIHTGRAEVEDDGTIKFGGEFRSWEMEAAEAAAEAAK